VFAGLFPSEKYRSDVWMSVCQLKLFSISCDPPVFHVCTSQVARALARDMSLLEGGKPTIMIPSRIISYTLA
jgi:hypothetical protein